MQLSPLAWGKIKAVIIASPGKVNPFATINYQDHAQGGDYLPDAGAGPRR
jgi:hypothetical protein